jgi:hypothetical protein
LVEGLHRNQSIKRLSLDGHFSSSAASSFANYMQSRNGSITSLKLRLIPYSTDLMCSSDPLIADLLKGPYGSGLQSLELQGLDVAGVWNALTVDTPTTALLSLKLEDFGWNRGACFECIPDLLFLRELEMHGSIPADQRNVFCQALKQNASLHEVSVVEATSIGLHSDDAYIPFKDWDANIVCRLKAWGGRNRHLPVLLASPRNMDSALHDNQGTVHMGNAQNLYLFPALFRVAQQTTRMSPRQLMVGLLSLDDMIGPRVQAPLRVKPNAF